LARKALQAHWEESRRSQEASVAKKAKLGTGKRFASLKKSLAKKGIKNPSALAASIGRKKYGAKKMAKLASAGRKRASKK
jgi:hypothetical protein